MEEDLQVPCLSDESERIGSKCLVVEGLDINQLEGKELMCSKVERQIDGLVVWSSSAVS